MISMPLSNPVLPIVCLALLSAGALRADEELIDTGGWLPSLALRVDVQAETDEGKILSTKLVPSLSDPDEPYFRPPASGERTFVTAIPDLQAEVMTPALTGLPGAPRLLVHAGWQWGLLAIEENRYVAKEGAPGEIVVPPSSPTAPLLGPPNQFGGQGSQLNFQIEDAWYAGLGLAFLVPIQQLEFRVRSSVDYYQQSGQLEGVLKDVDCVLGTTPRGPGCQKTSVQIREVRGSDDKKFHAVGPRLGVEYDVLESGPFVMSLFADGYVYWIVSDRKVSFTGESAVATANFDFEKGATVGGGGLGVRVRWQGISSE